MDQRRGHTRFERRGQGTEQQASCFIDFIYETETNEIERGQEAKGIAWKRFERLDDGVHSSVGLDRACPMQHQEINFASEKPRQRILGPWNLVVANVGVGSEASEVFPQQSNKDDRRPVTGDR